MKRYRVTHDLEMEEITDGEWVRWEDVSEMIDRLNYTLHDIDLDGDNGTRWKLIYVRRYLRKEFGEVFIDGWIKDYFCKYKGK